MSARIAIKVEDDIKQGAQRILYSEYINTELDKSIAEANDPSTKWLSQEEMKARMIKRREARSRV
jgi:hypothetical protein